MFFACNIFILKKKGAFFFIEKRKSWKISELLISYWFRIGNKGIDICIKYARKYRFFPRIYLYIRIVSFCFRIKANIITAKSAKVFGSKIKDKFYPNKYFLRVIQMQCKYTFKEDKKVANVYLLVRKNIEIYQNYEYFRRCRWTAASA